MTTIIDVESPPRSWLNEWVENAKTKQQLKQVIYEQQDRLDNYVKTIERLEKERSEILRWQVESTYIDMMQKGIIQRYKSALEEIAKYQGAPECVVLAETALRPS